MMPCYRVSLLTDTGRFAPVITATSAVQAEVKALQLARAQGRTVLAGGRVERTHDDPHRGRGPR